MRSCLIYQCENDNYARHLCRDHYRTAKPIEAYPKQKKSRGWVTVHGYREFSLNGAAVKEHRVVMEQILGRELLPGENVHHINGVRTDNRPENLELWVTSQPSGQRPEDLADWAEEILRRYRPSSLRME